MLTVRKRQNQFLTYGVVEDLCRRFQCPKQT